MPSHFTLRMQFGPRQDPAEIEGQMLGLVREAPVDEVMFFFFAEEQNDGHETLEQVREWIESSRPYREALKKAGIAVSLNPWHSILHCDRGRRLKPGQDWQTMMDPDGMPADAVVCPLDPAWQAYYFETLRLYAREGFRVVWIDDDIRYHNHEPLRWGGCFCPLHVAEFNRRMGVRADRAEIVSACLRPGKPHPWRAAWMDMWQETLLAFLCRCRDILGKGGTKMGLMSSGMGAHAAEGRRWREWWNAFGAGKPPVHRPHFWGYSDGMGTMLLYGIAALDQNRSIQPCAIESGPEIENYSYGRWNKSFRQTFAQMALAHVLGSTNLNISLYDFMGNRPDDEPDRADFLKRIRPTMDWLADRFPMAMKSVGVGVPWSEDMGRLARTEKGESWFELQVPSFGWPYWLGAAGIAFSAAEQKEVNALAGPMAWCFDDATIERWLASGLLLDGAAAAILLERGFGKLIGVKTGRFITQKDLLYSVEECRDTGFALRAGARISVNNGPHATRLFQASLDPAAVVISDLRGPRGLGVGHGAFVFENELGGRAAVVPWNAALTNTPVMDIHRAAQLSRLSAWLARGKGPGRVEGGAWLVPQFLKDSKTWRGAVWNASPDEIESFRLNLPAGMRHVSEAWQLTPNGERLGVSVNGDRFTLTQPMRQWELAVFQ